MSEFQFVKGSDIQMASGLGLNERFVFSCPSCGLRLSVAQHLSGISGPCPCCHFSVVSPTIPVASIVAVHEHVPYLQAGIKKQRQDSSPAAPSLSRKGRIMADLLVDHKHLEWKETTRTIRLISYAILAISLCVLVAWFLQAWSTK